MGRKKGMTAEMRAVRDLDVFERIHNGESADVVARDNGISTSYARNVYKRMWKEHCDMAAYEKVRESSGLNRLMQVGPDQYKGECHLPNGKVKTRRFDYDRPEAKERWLAWIEETELDWEERHQVPDEDVMEPPTPVEPHVEPEPAPEPTTAVVTYEERAVALYLMHRVDWGGTPMLFRSLDRALSTAASLGRVAGVDFDVTEVAFWDGED